MKFRITLYNIDKSFIYTVETNGLWDTAKFFYRNRKRVIGMHQV